MATELMAAEMKVTDAAVRAAADVMEEWHNDPGDQRGYNDAMRAALEAALAAMLEPVHQCMCTDEDETPNGPRDIWMDVSPADYDNLTSRNDVRGRVTYRLKDAK